jgi:hypothetical protein
MQQDDRRTNVSDYSPLLVLRLLIESWQHQQPAGVLDFQAEVDHDGDLSLSGGSDEAEYGARGK